ncbi:MAG: LptA/OstA family protein [bacterium]|nr:LptA/OstA family protein [bacterium]
MIPFAAALCLLLSSPPATPAPAATPAAKPPTVITSESLDLDHAANVAVFTTDVHVRDASGDIRSDVLTVHFDPEARVVRRLVATGRRVVIDTPGRRAVSRRAEYTAEDGRIVLTGNPHIIQGRNTYAADRITIFKDRERTIFEPKARMVFYSDEDAQPLEGLR